MSYVDDQKKVQQALMDLHNAAEAVSGMSASLQRNSCRQAIKRAQRELDRVNEAYAERLMRGLLGDS